jgi:Putative DNA-binding domain
MRTLFETIITEGEKALEELRDIRQQENVELEFKTKSHPQSGDLTKDDRRNLGQALSALSNSMGGLLVWGVRAEKNADDVDCATQLVPISQIEKFHSLLERAVSQAIMPRHEGIRLAAIQSQATPGAGYVVMYVDRSERRPHRSEFGDKQYFKRVGDSSIAMEHYDIEDSFKRLVVAWLTAEVTIQSGGTVGGPHGKFQIVDAVISLRNPSPATATFPYLVIDSTGEFRPTVDGGGQEYHGTTDHVIHPAMSRKVLALRRKVAVHQLSGGLAIARGALEPPTIIKYRCGSFNFRQFEGEIVITEDQIARAVNLLVVE